MIEFMSSFCGQSGLPANQASVLISLNRPQAEQKSFPLYAARQKLLCNLCLSCLRAVDRNKRIRFAVTQEDKVFSNLYLYYHRQLLSRYSYWRIGKGNPGMWSLRMGVIWCYVVSGNYWLAKHQLFRKCHKNRQFRWMAIKSVETHSLLYK